MTRPANRFGTGASYGTTCGPDRKCSARPQTTTTARPTSVRQAALPGGVSVGTPINSTIPAVFDAYATIVLPEESTDQARHDAALMSVLGAHATDSGWWLGYLDTGADDVVFPAAPRVRLYWDWPYVLILAGSEQAEGWRRWDFGSFWSGRLPNLMFPVDRCWLVSTLWDDDWTCVGGTAALIDALLGNPELSTRVRRVFPDQDATPPGHTSI